MMRRPPLIWILFIGLLLLAAPLAMLWRMTAGGGPALPISRFMPRRVSAVIRLSHAQAAWQRHWTRKPGPAPEDALKAFYIACDKWDRSVEKYGDIQARLRLTLYQQAFFQATGSEAWAAFGEWGGAAPGTGQIGLMIFLRGDTPLRARVAPLLNLVLGDYKIRRTRCEGETLLEYEGKTERRSVTFCQFGGWICVSLRQGGPGPLPEIIRQVRAGAAETSATQEAALKPLLEAPEGSAIGMMMRPGMFLDQMQAFNRQTGQKPSKKSRKRYEYWDERMAGIETLTLRQAGDAIFDFDLAAEGPRIAKINREAEATSSPLADLDFKITPAPRKEIERAAERASNEIAQLEFFTPMAAQTAGMAGYAWPELLEGASAFDLALPGLRARLDQALASKKHPGPGRIGLAAYPSPAVVVPYLFFWQTHGAAGARHGVTASQRLADFQNNAATSRTECGWIGLPPAGALAPATPSGIEYQSLVQEVWGMDEERPQAFLGINFRDLAAELDKLPNLFMKKDQRKQMERWKATFNSLALGAGAGAARIDAADGRWVMRVRMP